MLKTTPMRLAVDIAGRSRCSVQVGAVITDRRGILAWGWNYDAGGYGIHAEAHAIARANPLRLAGATIYVAGVRMRNGILVHSEPCDDCAALISRVGIGIVVYRDKSGNWIATRA